MSLRTALVLCSLTVVSDLIPAVDVNSLDTISETLFPILLKLTSQTKKLVSSEASTVLQSLMFHVPHPLRLLPQIASSVVDKNVQTRQVGIVLMQIVLTQITRQKVKKDAFDKINGSTVLEKALRKGLTDSNDMVRTISRDVFYLFDDLWSSKAKKFLSELDNSVKKAVERHTRSHFLEVAAARPVKAVSRPPSAVSQSDDGVSSDVPSDLEMLTTFHNRLSPNESGEFDTPLPPSDTLLLQSLIQRVIESDNESAHLYLCESRLLSHLVSLQLIHLEDVLGPLLVVMQRTVNSAVQRCISEQMEAISESVSSEQLFNILVSNIKHPQGPRLKSSQNKRLSLANEGLLGWILELVKQGPNAEMENYKSIRGCAVKLMPIFERGTSSKQLLDLATEVFLYINRDSCDLFARVLETYDQDVSNRVYAIMQAYQDEHEDLAFTAAEMDVEPTNQTFLEIEKDDDSSNVFDVRCF